MKLWIDDERVMPAEYTHMAMSSKQAIGVLDRRAWVAGGQRLELISFDHDLGGEFVGHELVEDTTRPVLLWMIENNVWPLEIRVHTANPVGREWLVGTARRYAPTHVLVGR